MLLVVSQVGQLVPPMTAASLSCFESILNRRVTAEPPNFQDFPVSKLTEYTESHSGRSSCLEKRAAAVQDDNNTPLILVVGG